jgi:hypothetical protein
VILAVVDNDLYINVTAQKAKAADWRSTWRLSITICTSTSLTLVVALAHQ